MHKIWPTPTNPHRARGLEPPDLNLGIHLIEVRRPAHEGPEATSHRTEPGEKMQMSPSDLCPTCLEADMVISTFSFDPNLSQAHRISFEGRPAGHLS